MNELLQARRKRLRTELLSKLGNKCTRCGFSDIRALQIDHINGGGTKEGKRLGRGENYINKLLSMSDYELKNKYQLLCPNCNWIKRIENNEATGRPVHISKKLPNPLDFAVIQKEKMTDIREIGKLRNSRWGYTMKGVEQ